MKAMVLAAGKGTFGNREWEGVAFSEEIEELKSRLNLEVMHVLSRPPEGWEGDEGRITAAVLVSCTQAIALLSTVPMRTHMVAKGPA